MYKASRAPAPFADRRPANTPADWGLFLLRLTLGVIFFAHGSQKVLGWFGGPGLGGTVHYMARMGIPAPLAYLAAFTELLGGIALILGLLSRLASMGLAVNMLVAILTAPGPKGFFAPKGFEYPLALLAMAVLIVLAGPGQIAVADLEARILRRRRY